MNIRVTHWFYGDGIAIRTYRHNNRHAALVRFDNGAVVDLYVGSLRPWRGAGI